jgi:hypothetical protein
MFKITALAFLAVAVIGFCTPVEAAPKSARAAVSCTSSCGPNGQGLTVCKNVVTGEEVSRRSYPCRRSR